MAQNVIVPKILTGFKNAGFCVDPEGNFAYIFVRGTFSFVRVDLKTGQHRPLKTKQPKLLIDKYCTSFHNAVLRSSKLYISSIFFNSQIKTWFAVSYGANNDVVSIVDEQSLDISMRVEYDVCHNFDKEQTFIFTYEETGAIINIDTTKVKINENGKIISTVIKRSRSSRGGYTLPFIHTECCYWTPKDDNQFQKLIKVSYNNWPLHLMIVKKEFQESPNSWIYRSHTLVTEDHVFFFVYTKQKTNALYIFNMKDKCWRKVHIDAGYHKIENFFYYNLKLSANDFLYLHGDCIFKDCKDEAHIFIIDIQKHLSIGNTIVIDDGKLVDLEQKATDYTESWQEKVIQFMSATESKVAELGEQYETALKECESLKKDIVETLTQISDRDGKYNERLHQLKEELDSSIKAIEGQYAQKLANITETVINREETQRNNSNDSMINSPEPSVTEQPPPSAERKLLTENMLKLCHDMIITEVIVYLRQKFVFNQVEVDEICSERTSFAKNYALIERLLRKDELTFRYFVQSLRESQQYHLVKIFSPEEEEIIPPSPDNENNSSSFSKELIESLEKTVIDQKKENESLRCHQNSMREEIEILKKDKDQLRKKHDLSKEQIQKLESEIEQANFKDAYYVTSLKEIETLKKEKSQLTTEYDLCREKIEQLECAIEALKNDSNQLNTITDHYKQQIELMKNEREQSRRMKKNVISLGSIILCPLIVVFALHIMRKWR